MNVPVINATAAAEPLIDPRLAFLADVATLYFLVQRDELDVVEAFEKVVERVNDRSLFQIVVPQPEPEPKSAAERAWEQPGWASAAREYAR